MEKLNELFALCKAEVYIVHNEHKGLYTTVANFLNDQMALDLDSPIADDVRKAMIEKDQMITIRAYLNTPIGFYIVYHWDLESAVDEMLSTLIALRKVTND